MTLNRGSTNGLKPQNSGSKGAYVPKKGDIRKVGGFSGLWEMTGKPWKNINQELIPCTKKGLSLDRIRKEQRLRDEKLKGGLKAELTFIIHKAVGDFNLIEEDWERIYEGIEKVFAEVDK